MATILKVVEEGKESHELMLPKYKESANTILKISVIVYLASIFVKFITAYVLDDFILKLLNENISQSLNRSKIIRPFDTVDLQYFIALVIMILVNYGALHICIKKKWIYETKRLIAVLCVVCSVFYCVYLTNETNGFTSKLDTYEGNDYSATDALDYNYRVDNGEEYDHSYDNGDSTGNYAMINNKPAIAAKNSFKSLATSGFARIAGYRNTEDPASFAYFSTPAIQTVLNVAEIKNQNGGYDAAEYYVPMGYVYEYYIADDCEYVTDEKINNSRI